MIRHCKSRKMTPLGLQNHERHVSCLSCSVIQVLFFRISVFLVKYFEPGQFRSLRQTVVFRDDFNHFNKGHFTTEVSAWGGGVRYCILILCPILFAFFILWSTFGLVSTRCNVVNPGHIICERLNLKNTKTWIWWLFILVNKYILGIDVYKQIINIKEKVPDWWTWAREW